MLIGLGSVTVVTILAVIYLDDPRKITLVFIFWATMAAYSFL